MTQQQSTITGIQHPLAKSATAIGAAGAANSGYAETVATKVATSVAQEMHNPDVFWAIVSLPWGTIASMAAAFYTTMLCLEWLWKKPVKSILIFFKVIKPETKLTVTQWAELTKEK